jgi:hypothetical protein
MDNVRFAAHFDIHIVGVQAARLWEMRAADSVPFRSHFIPKNLSFGVLGCRVLSHDYIDYSVGYEKLKRRLNVIKWVSKTGGWGFESLLSCQSRS